MAVYKVTDKDGDDGWQGHARAASGFESIDGARTVAETFGDCRIVSRRWKAVPRG